MTVQKQNVVMAVLADVLTPGLVHRLHWGESNLDRAQL